MTICVYCLICCPWNVFLISWWLSLEMQVAGEAFLCLDWKRRAFGDSAPCRENRMIIFHRLNKYKHRTFSRCENLRGIVGREFPQHCPWALNLLLVFSSGNSPCFRFFKFSFPFNFHRCCSSSVCSFCCWPASEENTEKSVKKGEKQRVFIWVFQFFLCLLRSVFVLHNASVLFKIRIAAVKSEQISAEKRLRDMFLSALPWEASS